LLKIAKNKSYHSLKLKDYFFLKLKDYFETSYLSLSLQNQGIPKVNLLSFVIIILVSSANIIDLAILLIAMGKSLI